MDEQPTSGTIRFDEKITTTDAVFIKPPEYSEWVCYMFGNRPSLIGMIYRPVKGCEPSWFVRWMMGICFDCLWVNEKHK